MTESRVNEVLARIERARAAILATGEVHLRSEGGRAPSRSEAFIAARNELDEAERARNRLLVDLVGPGVEAVPKDLAASLGLTGREAVHIVATARGGSARMRERVLGEDWP